MYTHTHTHSPSAKTGMFFFFSFSSKGIRKFLLNHCVCLVAQSCLTLCNPMDCSLPSSSVHGDSPGKNTGVGCQALLQGIVPTQGLNPGLLHCRWILYRLSHQGSWWLTINRTEQTLMTTYDKGYKLYKCRKVTKQKAREMQIKTTMRCPLHAYSDGYNFLK